VQDTFLAEKIEALIINKHHHAGQMLPGLWFDVVSEYRIAKTKEL